MRTNAEVNAATSADDHVTPFVVLFEGRSGSTYLMEGLNSHPWVHAIFEPMVPLAKEGAESQIGFVTRFFSSPGDHRAVGFKTKLKDVLDPTRLAEELRRLQAKIILLERRNRIKLVVSLYNSVRLNEATGDWNLYDEKDRLAPAAMDPEVFISWLEKLEDWNRKLRKYTSDLGLATLSLCYEDLLVEQQATFNRVFSFLGVEPQPVTGNARKNTSDDLREALPNFEVIRTSYVGTPYLEMFDEVLVHDER